MNIHLLLTPAGQGLPVNGQGLKTGGLPVEGIFAQHFSQASDRAALPPGELASAFGGIQPGVADALKPLDQSSAQPDPALAPLAQGIAQANARLGVSPSVEQPLPEPVTGKLPDIETTHVELAAIPVQDALDVVRERMALIEQAGLKPDTTASESSPALAVSSPMGTTGNVTPRAPAPTGAQLSTAMPSMLAAISGTPGNPSTQPRMAATEGRYQSHVAVDGANMANPTTVIPASASTPATPPSDLPAEALIAREASLMRRGQSGEGGIASGSKEGSGINFTGLIQGTAPQPTAMAGQPTTAMISAPLASPQWQQQINQQLIGLHQRGGQQIELHLNPADLGPLSVSLKMTEQGAQAQFLSANAQVRSALEQGIPQLREALQEQGIALGEAMVSDHPQQQQQQAENGASRRSPGFGNSTEAQPAADAIPTSLASQPGSQALDGRVDLYA
ncbi:flagellar hook-length control protein FliK [Litchfieldella xinjiangensis]|uniref:flagellar hook-length control protein FliK n=1 Tax=Litchfieldella xinjiangensis TaxID=1166948 RepID=UPI0006936C79|nr:flagellar hook-length control protein FliK [Halomonas xinjiangensis]